MDKELLAAEALCCVFISLSKSSLNFKYPTYIFFMFNHAFTIFTQVLFACFNCDAVFSSKRGVSSPPSFWNRSKC